jgi:uncharacterized damage-inducible protein DinB
MRHMAEDTFVLTMFSTQWKAYQEHIKEAVAPLTAEQLALRPSPGLRSIGENATHIIDCRIGWFTPTLGEDGGEIVKSWEAQDGSVRSAAELAQALDTTWQLMTDCLARWSPSDMQQTFPDDWEGEIVHLPRAWVIWHVLEHDLHHGGELSLTLGMHGLKSGFTS